VKLKNIFEDDRTDTKSHDPDAMSDEVRRAEEAAKKAKWDKNKTEKLPTDSNANTEVGGFSDDDEYDELEQNQAIYDKLLGHAKAKKKPSNSSGEELAGTSAYFTPERLRAAGYKGDTKTPAWSVWPKKAKPSFQRSPFGKKAMVTSGDLPPFPYHPGELRDKHSEPNDEKPGRVEKNAVTDPESQIYYVLESEGPLHWKDIFAKIVPYLKELTSAGLPPPQFDAYGEAVVNLLKRGAIKKTTEGKYYSSF